jgi:hypothetical protein
LKNEKVYKRAKEESLPNMIIITNKNIHKKKYNSNIHEIIVFNFDDVELEEFVSNDYVSSITALMKSLDLTKKLTIKLNNKNISDK